MAVAGNNGLKLELEADNWYNTLCLNVGGGCLLRRPATRVLGSKRKMES
jgi:hypothetical protein